MRFARVVPALLLVLTTPAVAAVPQGWDPARFMGVEELRPGMTGVGRSVFRGSEIEEFGVEILGVLPTPDPGGDIILARLSGQGLEKSGVIAGMSGSPIYIDGRLIGALALGWPFATEPITGITPIAEMLALRERPAGISGAGRGGGGTPQGGGLDPAVWERLWTVPAAEVLPLLSGATTPSASTGFPDIRTPLSVSGFDARGMTALERGVAGSDLLPVQGGSMGSDGSADEGLPLRPGSAVGVQLVRGDAQIAAVGTVTWVDGDEVFAFGHPMMSRGGSDYPMAPARIITVMPRASSSFKMGAVGRAVGAIRRDYRPGVMGNLGAEAAMIPMSVRIDGGDVHQTTNFEILDAPALTPALAGAVAVNAMDMVAAGSGEVTLTTHTEVELADGRRVSRDNLIAGFSPPDEVAGEVARLVALIHGNPSEPVTLRAIRITVSMVEEVKASFLDGVETDPRPVRPGERVPIRLVLRDYRGGIRRVETELTVPPGTPAGDYELRVCDGGSADDQDRERAPGRFAPRDLDRLLALLAAERPGDALVVSLYDSGRNPVVAGRELDGLPMSLKLALTNRGASGRTSTAEGTLLAERTERMGRLLIGCRSVSLRVEP